MDDYWIDTDHLLLAILRAGSSPGAAMLNKVGFRLNELRDLISKTSDSRDNHGPVPSFWRLTKPISRIGKVAGFLYLLGILVLVRVLTEVGCGFKR
jgi:hypothetical protein